MTVHRLPEKEPKKPITLRSEQRQASDPRASAWVAANAGSGKTFVLAQRVLRLLLDGTPPDRLLCLTFTKAAAAEMSNRVFNALRDWAIAPEENLSTHLQAMTNRPPTAVQLTRARTLFARALETPGGLKIQTIHAFCERLLNRFPFEAGVAAHFSVLDDLQTARMLEDARDHVLRNATNEPEGRLGFALSTIIAHVQEDSLSALLREVISERSHVQAWMRGAGGIDEAYEQLRQALSIHSDDGFDLIKAEIMASPHLPRDRWPEVALALKATGETKNGTLAGKIEHAIRSDPSVTHLSWLAVFCLKDALDPVKSVGSNALRGGAPGVQEALDAELDRLGPIMKRLKALEVFEASKALFTLAHAALGHYARVKTNAAMLDYEDLIDKAHTLLQASGAATWVLYKLDGGIDHILVDEAQDTSPRQWEIVKQITEEFFSGAGARDRTRTVFAVGDEKQSIYSFQGADPQAFSSMRRMFGLRVRRANETFSEVKLKTSFRTTPEILKAVDAVFNGANVARGVSTDPVWPAHEPERGGEPGLVEIWPLTEPPAKEDQDLWTLPVDQDPPHASPVACAERIAAVIRQWLDAGALVSEGGPPIKPGDIMILVSKRTAIVDPMIRALKRNNIPVAGADRLTLTDHIAVMDLLAVAEFALLPEDDLTLATVLKTPLIELDDHDLIALAPGRSGTLWDALKFAAITTPRYKIAVDTLSHWLSRADIVSPFDFFSQILSGEGGRKAFRRRLGSEVDDVLDEFLKVAESYERQETPSLQTFVAYMQESELTIKRDMEGNDSGSADDPGVVRVMTVHGAKGLEAKIVFLADTARPPERQRLPKILALENPLHDPAPLVWTVKQKHRTAAIQERLDTLMTAQMEEYRRLLYVAMTRARDRLYICGFKRERDVSAQAWYEIIQNAELAGKEHVPDPYGLGFDVERIGRCGLLSGQTPSCGAPKDQVAVPRWCKENPPEENEPRRFVAPSSAWMGTSDSRENLPDQASPLPFLSDHPDAVTRGLAIHQLLQKAPNVAAVDAVDWGAWRKSAGLFLQNRYPDMAPEKLSQFVDEALNVMTDPACAPLFGHGARAEVPVIGKLGGEGTGRDTLHVSGIVDRLVVTPKYVAFADFKTARIVPPNADQVDPAILSQMAIYRSVLSAVFPHHETRALLVWTAGPVVMPLNADLLMRHG